MNDAVRNEGTGTPVDTGLLSLLSVASYYRISGDLGRLRRELNLELRPADESDLLRAAKLLGLKARAVSSLDRKRLLTIPLPAVIKTRIGGYAIMVARAVDPEDDRNVKVRIVDPVTKSPRDMAAEGVDQH